MPTYAPARDRRGCQATTAFAATISSSRPLMTMELTTQVVPNSNAILLTICASSSKNPAPRKKKCH